MGDKEVISGNSKAWQKQQTIAARTAYMALTYSLTAKDVDCVRFALEQFHADPNFDIRPVSCWWQPATHAAIVFSSPGSKRDIAAVTECLQLLLDHGANVDMRDEYGETALCVAISHGSVPIVELLLDAAQLDGRRR